MKKKTMNKKIDELKISITREHKHSDKENR